MTPFKAARLIGLALAALTLVVLGTSQAAPATFAQPPDQGIIDVDLHIQHPNVPVNTQTGEVSVRGTLSCAQPPGSTGQLFLNIGVTQPVGQLGAVQGGRFVSGTCLGAETPFVFTITGSNGLFVGGLAYINAFVSNCVFSPPPPELTPTPEPAPTATPAGLGVQPQQVAGCDTDEANETVFLQPSLTTLPERSIQDQQKEP